MGSDGAIRWKVEKSQARFTRVKNPHGRDTGHGEFFLLLAVSAIADTVYLPISIASGKRATGFIYQIEGTAEGTISTTDISCRGDRITTVTLGTLLYAKIPSGATATFRILIEIDGYAGEEYKIVLNRINYKFDPRDARYTRFDTAIESKTAKFR